MLYYSRRDISDADEVPPSDSDNWRDLAVHRLVGFGEDIEDHEAELQTDQVFFDDNLDADETSSPAAPIDYAYKLPQSLLERHSNALRSRVDDVEITFKGSSNSHNVDVVASGVDAGTNVTLQLQGQVTDGAWTTIYSATGLMSGYTHSGNYRIPLIGEPFDIDFTLEDEGDTFKLRYRLEVNEGGIDSFRAQGRRWDVVISGAVGTRHELTMGTGDDENKLVIQDLSLIHISEPTRPY